MLTGDNGLLTKATTSKERTERAKIIEEAKVDLMGVQADKEGKIVASDLRGVLDKYFKEVPEEITNDDIETLELTTKPEYGDYAIKVSEIWSSPFKKQKIFFNIIDEGLDAGYSGESHGGLYEVEESTTWEEFFVILHPEIGKEWMYDSRNGILLRYLYDWYIVQFSLIIDPSGNRVGKDDFIRKRNICNWRSCGLSA